VQTIVLETRIAAPTERCFLLSLSIDLHLASTTQTGEHAIAGVTRGLIGLGETVTWQGRHFGILLAHETLITEYNNPSYFQDVMVKGAFHSFVHDHHFEPIKSNGTLMRDRLQFSAPLGPLGLIVEHLVLRRYLTQFLAERNRVIQRVAEDKKEWKQYVG
jgi:ligand-binding SRPBCC domain-containing protein